MIFGNDRTASQMTMIRRTILFLIYICTGVVVSCDSSKYNEADRFDGKESAVNGVAEESAVFEQSKIFLHLLLGGKAVDYYSRPSFPTEIVYHPKKRRWGVFFNYPLGGFNIEMNADASKGNYKLMNGRVIKRDASIDYKIDNIPLYSISEMIDVFQMEHNRALIKAF
jgi:hypothetical protein